MNQQAFDHSIDYIKSWLRFRYEHEEIPGFVVAVMHKGRLVLHEAYGYADLETKTELTTDHIFRIASHSKTFTATALMQLQEQGKLRIDEYAVDHLPWLGQHTDKRWQKVTLRQLMLHSAGVIRDGLNADYWQLERPFPSREDLKKEILESDLIIDNNIKLKYSNFGYSLLGMVIESASGISYNQYVIEHIVGPLGLKNTGPEYIDEIQAQLATGYTRRDVHKTRLPIAHVDTRAMASATGFYATARDLCTYFAAQHVGSGKLLDDESKKEMQRMHFQAHTPRSSHTAGYGLGIDIHLLQKRTTFGHGGGFPGHSTNSLTDPHDDLTVVTLTNCIDGLAGTITKSIYGIVDHFQENTPKNEPTHNMTQLAGRYMNLWGLVDVVPMGDKVFAADPNSWQPFQGVEQLEYVDDTTLKVVETNSFNAEGELVRFNMKDGGVETINYNGSTMWPEATWLHKLEQLKRVG